MDPLRAARDALTRAGQELGDGDVDRRIALGHAWATLALAEQLARRNRAEAPEPDATHGTDPDDAVW